MFCMQCKNDLSVCICDDLDERMASLNNDPNFIYKKCRACDKHYSQCKCESPDWTTSHEGVELKDLGYNCQHCNAEIDGDQTGSPRNCIPCESDNPRYEEER